MKPIYLSIVIPAFNEETNIRLGALDKVIRYLERQAYTYEIILVNDGSTDDTIRLLKEYEKTTKYFVLVDNPHLGKANSVVAGMEQATGNNILFSDLDQATPIAEIEKLAPWLEKGYDLVIGSRSSKREGAPLLRLIMARGFIFLRFFLLGLGGISDTQCGFKIFRRSVSFEIIKRLRLYKQKKRVHGPTVSAGFDIELIFIAQKLGYKIKEVPVEWHYVETRRVNPLKDSWQGFTDILRIRINSLKGAYK